MKSVGRHTWEKGRQYLQKMGTIILAASIIVWALTYFPRGTENMTAEQQMEQSYIGRIGKVVEPVIKPCGFGWKEGVSIITGIGAKEIVASTMGVLYTTTDNAATQQTAEATTSEVSTSTPTDEEDTDEEVSDEARLSRIIATHSNLTPVAAFAFLIFVLLYMPCLPACVAIKNESGHWRWAAFTMFYTTALAWLCAIVVYQIGMLL